MAKKTSSTTYTFRNEVNIHVNHLMRKVKSQQLLKPDVSKTHIQLSLSAVYAR